MWKKSFLQFVGAVILFVSIAPAAFAQTTAFTYQGRLNDNGAPAHGTYDLRITVYDANTNGNALRS